MEAKDQGNADSLMERLKILQHVYELFNSEELEFIKDRNKRSYHLYPFPKETQEFSFSNVHQPIQLTKYVIQGIGDFERVDSSLLDRGTLLYQDLSSLIQKVLGDEYVIIFCRETDAYIHYLELFGVKFYNIFNQGSCGTIIFTPSRQHEKHNVITMKMASLDADQMQIDLDLVYPKAMSYQGSSIRDKHILFYGFDVEANRYLAHFFLKSQPKAILNIIPYRTNSFLYDNVD